MTTITANECVTLDNVDTIFVSITEIVGAMSFILADEIYSTQGVYFWISNKTDINTYIGKQRRFPAEFIGVVMRF